MSSQQKVKDVKWVQGLRGLASVVVLATHIARAFDYPLFFPQDNPDTPPRILQLPIVRLVGQGRIGVPIFAFVTGFVCALKPLRLLRNGPDGQGAGLKSIVKSASTRAPRMVLPAALATVISCAVCASGWYEAANHAENWFVRYDSPVRKDNIFEELGRLMQAILDTWTTGDNVYDRHQWAMQPLLMVAFYTYVLLLVVTRMKFAFRLGVYIFMMTYWWANCQKGSETFGSLSVLGVLIADLSLHGPCQELLARRQRLLSYLIGPLIILVGLYIGSYPGDHPDWTLWSAQMRRYLVNNSPPEGQPKGTWIVPEGTSAQERLSSLAIQLCAVGIFLSPALRNGMSHKLFLWLGNHSFAVYLLHGTILRTVAIWISYGMVPQFAQNADGHTEEFTHVLGGGHVASAIVSFIILTYALAWAWMRWVDTFCEGITDWMVSKSLPQDEKQAWVHSTLPV